MKCDHTIKAIKNVPCVELASLKANITKLISFEKLHLPNEEFEKLEKYLNEEFISYRINTTYSKNTVHCFLEEAKFEIKTK